MPLLIVDDEPDILNTVGGLAAREFDVLTARSAETAQAIMSQRCVEIIVADQRMAHTTGIQLLEWVSEHYPKTVRLLDDRLRGP